MKKILVFCLSATLLISLAAFKYGTKESAASNSFYELPGYLGRIELCDADNVCQQFRLYRKGDNGVVVWARTLTDDVTVYQPTTYPSCTYSVSGGVTTVTNFQIQIGTINYPATPTGSVTLLP